jgi:hypothetical protein
MKKITTYNKDEMVLFTTEVFSLQTLIYVLNHRFSNLEYTHKAEFINDNDYYIKVFNRDGAFIGYHCNILMD